MAKMVKQTARDQSARWSPTVFSNDSTQKCRVCLDTARRSADTMTKMLKQTARDQSALVTIHAAITADDGSKLSEALVNGGAAAVRAGVPARGSGKLPLQAAARAGRKAMVEALLDAGAPVDALDGSGLSALQVRGTRVYSARPLHRR